MQDRGRLVAHDLHKNKIKLVQNHAKRLNLSIIEASPLDARNLTNKYENETFDRILIDAPCSGLGVIRNKPDIKYNKSLADVEKLQLVQGDILEEARSEEHTSELQSRGHLVCRLLLEKKKSE